MISNYTLNELAKLMICTKCERVLPRAEFSKRGRKSATPLCKTCLPETTTEFIIRPQEIIINKEPCCEECQLITTEAEFTMSPEDLINNGFPSVEQLRQVYMKAATKHNGQPFAVNTLGFEIKARITSDCNCGCVEKIKEALSQMTKL